MQQQILSTGHSERNEYTGLLTTWDRGYYVHQCEFEGYGECQSEATLKCQAQLASGLMVPSTDYLSCEAHRAAVEQQAREANPGYSYYRTIVVEPFVQEHREQSLNVKSESYR